MTHLKLTALIFLVTFFLFASSCNSLGTKKNNTLQASGNDTSLTTTSPTSLQDNNQLSDATVKSEDSSASAQNPATDSMLSQLKNITSMLGKNDSGTMNNMASGGNIDSILSKLQSMPGAKLGNIGDVIGKSLLNFQLGQMGDNNPLKSVSKGMLAAQQNGTAGPSKTYTATYTDEQPVDYTIPISGDGNTVMLQYTGGSIANGKKDGLWKNVYVSTNTANQWNVYSEAYTESSAINMKVHATSLSGIHENYSINTNDQYKKYNKQSKSDLGKNESGVQVQKIGAEKMFGYNCMHVKVTYTIKALGQVAHEQDDEWYSDEVPGAQFLSPVIFENHSPVVVKQITGAGCSGVLIKSITKSSGTSQLVKLSSIIKKDMPDSTFILPANYQEDKNTALYDIQ